MGCPSYRAKVCLPIQTSSNTHFYFSQSIIYMITLGISNTFMKQKHSIKDRSKQFDEVCNTEYDTEQCYS